MYAAKRSFKFISSFFSTIREWRVGDKGLVGRVFDPDELTGVPFRACLALILTFYQFTSIKINTPLDKQREAI